MRRDPGRHRLPREVVRPTERATPRRSRTRKERSMNIALTGGTGFVGSHVLTELVSHGHEVTAIVRNEDEAITVATHGAKAAVVDLYDRAAVVMLLKNMDASAHAASPGDETS